MTRTSCAGDWRTPGSRRAGWHVGLERLEGELDDVVEQARVLGIAAPRRPLGGAARRPSRRRRSGGASLSAPRPRHGGGPLQLGYHNHGHEVEPLADGTVVLDVLAEVDGLELELDLGWLWAAGSDPVARLETHAGRVPLVHAKDFGDDGETSIPVGDGTVGYERIVPAARDAGVEWLVAEQEEITGDPLEATARSAEFLRRLL